MPASFSLLEAQTAFAEAVVRGPDAIVDGLFAGSYDHVIRGLKVHANTISHARLVALEETFPKTREALGHAAFNTLSRGYVEAGHGSAYSLDRVGLGFPHWLEWQGVAAEHAALARFEWVWLASYHANDVAPLSHADLATCDAAALLALRVSAHPAAHLLRDDGGLAETLGVTGAGGWILLVRPAAEVIAQGADEATAALFLAFSRGASIAEVAVDFMAQHPGCDFLATMTKLVTIGALSKEKMR